MFIFFKASISVSLLAIIFFYSPFDYNAIFDIRLNPFFLFALLTSFYFFEIFIGTLKFAWIAALIDQKFKFDYLLRTKIVGHFFSQILPSSAGGDFYRFMSLSRLTNNSIAFFIIFLDRYVGLLKLVVFIPISYFILVLKYDVREIFMEYFVFFVPFIFIFFSYFAYLVVKYIFQKKNIYLEEATKLIVLLKRNIKKIKFVLRITLAAIFVHIGSIVTFFLACKAVGLDIEFFLLFFIVPLVFLATLIPISFGGWGVREITFVFLFQFFDFDLNSIVIASMTYGLGNLLFTLPSFMFIKKEDFFKKNSSPQSRTG